MSGAALNRHRSKQDYATPWELIRAVEDRFGPISVDLAASPANTKATSYFTEEDNSLIRFWHKYPGILWLNPPFSNIAPWAKKCANESAQGAKIIMLAPASVGANWFVEHVHQKAMVLALQGRITFEGATDPYPKDCILSCYGFGVVGFDVWKWR
jgi:DNA (cytosine-5)-methyltransferase 1